MTATLIFALGLGVVLVRRRSLAIGLVTAQSLALGVLALDAADEWLVPGIVLLVKAAVHANPRAALEKHHQRGQGSRRSRFQGAS